MTTNRGAEKKEPVTQGHLAALLVYRPLPGNVCFPEPASHHHRRKSQERREVGQVRCPSPGSGGTAPKQCSSFLAISEGNQIRRALMGFISPLLRAQCSVVAWGVK